MSDIKAAGGLTIAQSEESCVVYGMPKAAIERGNVSRILSLDALVPALLAECASDPKTETQSGHGISMAAGSGKD